MNRQSLVKKNFSSEDLHQTKKARNSFTAGEREIEDHVPIIAEIDMINTHKSDGAKVKVRKAHRVKSKSFQGKRRPHEEKDTGYSCRLF